MNDDLINKNLRISRKLDYLKEINFQNKKKLAKLEKRHSCDKAFIKILIAFILLIFLLPLEEMNSIFGISVIEDIAIYLVFGFVIFNCYIVIINIVARSSYFLNESIFCLNNLASNIKENDLRIKHICIILISLPGLLISLLLLFSIKFLSKIMDIKIFRLRVK